MSRRRFGSAGTEPTAKQRRELRIAALRRWEPDSSMTSMAERLHVPEPWLWRALDGTMREISQHWGRKPKGNPRLDWSAEVGEKLRLPRPFVAFTFRHLWGEKQRIERRRTTGELRRVRSNEARTEHINRVTGSAWRS